MKFKINIECSPKEAREFFGLPDVESFQRATLEEVKRRTSEYLDSLEPEKLVKMWMPMGMEALDAMQKTFAQFVSAGVGSKKDKSARKEKDA